MWPEATYRVCGQTAEDSDGIEWTCTREEGHDANHLARLRRAHDDGHIVIGLAWTLEA